MTGRLYYWIADWSLSRAHAALLLGGAAVDMVDCTHAALARVHATSIRRFAGYVTGSPDIRWTAGDFLSLPHGSAAVRIDQSNSDLPLTASVKVAKDVEPGASTPHEAIVVARERLLAGDSYTIYCDRSELPAVEQQAAAAGLPPGRIIGFQYASPTSNPDTRLPGTIFTLKEANADLSVVLESWLPLPDAPAPHAHPSPAHGHSLARAHVAGTGTVELDLRDMRWRNVSGHVAVTPEPWGD